MCGICGKFHFDRSRIVRKDEIVEMSQLLHHRGPDDSGVYLSENVGLGFRRLSIIDLDSGHQPMSNEDGSLWIVFNGEIYNHNSLRKKLIANGHKFKSRSDTETIIHLFEDYGPECVKHLRGMFAFAIWDMKNQNLFCARDRFGIKPFYYFLDDSTFLFGSEIKSVASQIADKITLAVTELDHYLAYGYTSASSSIYAQIKKLPPAHFLQIDLSGRSDINRYWKIQFQPDYSKSEGEWCELIEEKLSESVKSHLMSDVPLGAFLSGGIDSSAVVAMMSEHSHRPVKTFSIGFKEAQFNELDYARIVAKRYGTEHYEKVLEPESVDILPKLVEAYDEPFADSSAIPTYLVSKFAREFVTVALSGDGGDELFAGYKHYSKFKRITQYNLLPSFLNPPVWGSLHKLIPNGMTGKGMAYYLSKHKGTLLAYQTIWQIHEREKLYRQGVVNSPDTFQAEKDRVAYLNKGDTGDFIFNMQQLDMTTFMVDDILTKVDRASMQNSLEVRVPILDHEFAELTFNIPSEFKLKGPIKKYILKQALKKHLPDTILSNRKQGFNLPLSFWFKEDLNDYVNDCLLDPNSPLYDFLNPNYVKKIVHAHNSGMRDFNKKIWSLICLDQWLKSKK